MNETIEALGWTLIHFCWQAAAIVVLYRVFDAIFSRSRSHVRYALALAAMLGMFVAGAASFGYEQNRISHESAMRAQATVNGHAVPGQPECNTPAAASVPTPGGIKGLVANLDRTWIAARGMAELVLRSLPRGLMSWIDALWLAGVFTLSVRMFGGWMTIRRLQLSTRAKAPVAVYAAFIRLATQMGITRRVDLLVCSRIAGPMAMGVMRSVVLLPVSALTHLSPEQLEVVLAHELAHIRRGDYLWNMVQAMVETLFFFHPAVWWLGGRTRQLRELCCDDAALEYCGDPVVYATALLRLEEQRSLRPRLAMALDGNSSSSSLKQRIVRILDGVQGERSIKRREAIPLSLAGVVAMMGMLMVPGPRVLAGKAVVEEKAGPRSSEAQTATISKAVPQQGTSEPRSTPQPSSQEPVSPDAMPEPLPLPAMIVTISPSPVRARIAAPAPVIALTPTIAPAPTPAPAPAAPLAPAAITISPAPAPGIVAVPAAPMAPLAPSVAITLRSKIKVDRALNIAQTTVSPRSYAILFQSSNDAPGKEDYVKGMRDLGYTDLDKLIALKTQGVTVDYARRMAKIGYGTPSADDLMSLRIFGVTPEEIEKLRASGLAPGTIQQLISYRIFKVTAEYAAQMKEAGFGAVAGDKLIALRLQNVTPEFARSMHQKYPDVTVDQLIQMKIFRIDEEFIASAKDHGFNSLSVDKLVKLRMSGLLDDNSVKR